MALGGNAVDGAVAANAVQGVVAPETCGVGGDLFALVLAPGNDAPAVLNASGRAGRGADAQSLRAAGHAQVPLTHPEAVTVPGCVEGWSELHRRFGKLPLSTILEPAIRQAAEGFTVSDELAGGMQRLREDWAKGSPGPTHEPEGAAPRPGDRMVRSELAATLEAISSGGRDAFYEGEAGRAIVKATGGRITMEDLAGMRSDWVQPLGLDVFGLTGWTVPPNSRGYATLAAAWLFEQLEPPLDPEDPDYFHLLIEAEELLNPARLSRRLDLIDRTSVATWPPAAAPPGGTAYLCVLDRAGMGVSLIQSNYTGFGGGISAEGTGFFLHNRGAGFNLHPGHPNELAPGKRPLHTLSPTLWTKDGRLKLLLGTRGGSYQPQVLVQVAANLLYAGLAPRETQARPRWVIDPDPERVRLEATAGESIRQSLESRGHDVEFADECEPGWGPVSLITVDESGLRTGVADPRVATTAAAVHS